MKILITGGSGKIGKYVVNRLAKKHQVRIFDVKEPASGNYEFIKGDILKLSDISEAAKKVDAIVHLAAIPDPLHDPPDKIMMVNAMGTWNVLKAAVENGVERVLFTSTNSVSGFCNFWITPLIPEYLPLDEQHPDRPTEMYGFSKYTGEKMCKVFTKIYGLKTYCLRLLWVWAPDFNINFDEVIQAPVERGAPPLWGYVEAIDVAQAFDLCLDFQGADHETFYIGAETTYRPEESLYLIKRCYPKVANINKEYFTNKNASLYNINKAKKILGYEPKSDWRKYVKPDISLKEE